MALPLFSLKELMEAGVHFGHNTSRWNPKMGRFIFGKRNGIHILDLQQTVPMMYTSLGVIRNAVAGGGRILFVGTKRQAQDIVLEAAERSGQYYVNHRWLGGMLTNWKTIGKSIKRLKELEHNFANPDSMAHLTKKERLQNEREFQKLHQALGGIKDMQGLPDVVVVFDAKKESIAIAEANNLGIPVVGIVDSNVSPDGIDYPIPGNDDAARALKLYARLMSDAVLDGISAQVSRGAQASTTNKTTVRKTVVKMSPKATAAAKDATEETATVKTETKKSATVAKAKEAAAPKATEATAS